MDVAPTWLAAQKAKWSALAETWTDTGPPASPSPEDVKNFVTLLSPFLGGATSNRLALLGSTPALRKELPRQFVGCSVTIVDFSPEMYGASSARLPTDLVASETFVERNWLDLAAWTQLAFSAVVGDKALDNVPFDHWRTFFEAIHLQLSDGGVLVLHVGLPDPQLQGRSFTEVYSVWRRRLATGETSVDQAACGLWEDLLSASASADPDNRRLSLSTFAVDLHDAGTGPQGDAIVSRLLELFPGSLAAEWTRFGLQDVATAASPWFELGDTLTSADYVAAHLQPLIALVRR